MTMNKSYYELCTYETFEERFKYLELKGIVSEITFGSYRMLNQILYKSKEWLDVRDRVIVRDNACDLGLRGYEILDIRDIPNINRIITPKIIVHHINPITIEDVLNRNPCVLDMNNLITTILNTHNGIHYGVNNDTIISKNTNRQPNDTCPWLIRR